MLADREHLVGCNLRWPRRSELEVTRSAGLIIQQQAPFLQHTDPQYALTYIQTCACTLKYGRVPTVAAGSWGDVLQLVKAGLSVSFNSLSQRSNSTTAMHAASDHWPAQQHSIKAAQTPCELTQPRTGKQQRGMPLIYTDRSSRRHQCSKRSHMYVENPYCLSHTIKSWYTTLNNSGTCGVLLSVQHYGHMFHIE